MGVRIAGCLEDQTAGMKGDRKTVVLKEICAVCQVCVFIWKKDRYFYGNLVCDNVLYVSVCTEHVDIVIHYIQESVSTPIQSDVLWSLNNSSLISPLFLLS